MSLLFIFLKKIFKLMVNLQKISFCNYFTNNTRFSACFRKKIVFAVESVLSRYSIKNYDIKFSFKLILLIISLNNFLGCRESEKLYNSEVKIIRMDSVNFNEKNEPTTIDIEISYHICPGNQFEVIRGNAEFAKCINQTGKKVGDKFLVDIEWKWNTLGYYKWFVVRLDSCERVVDPLDEVSFDLVEECEDYKVYNNVVGFICRRIPSGNLIKACPWFRRN